MNKKPISGFEDLNEDPYQMSIIVKDTKDFTAPELITAIATAVADFAPVRQEAAERGQNWEEWLSGRFRKIVKRLKPSLFNKLSSSLEEDKVEYLIVVGKVDLIIISPQPKSFAPSYMKRAQLSGLTVVDSILPSKSDSQTTVVVNSECNMSISKMAVSAAHALQMAKQFAYDSDLPELSDWNPLQASFVWRNLDDSNEYTVDVVDAGLTEVEPGTMTAAAIVKV